MASSALMISANVILPDAGFHVFDDDKYTELSLVSTRFERNSMDAVKRPFSFCFSAIVSRNEPMRDCNSAIRSCASCKVTSASLNAFANRS